MTMTTTATMSTTSVVVDLQSKLPALDAILSGISHVHASCIEHDKTEATFLPPLSHSKIMQWWNDRFQETETGQRRIWVELHPISSRRSQLDSPLTECKMPLIHLEEHPDETFEVAGVVALYMPVTETGPMRGDVHKLLVSPNHRRKGIAKRLMAELERFALKQDRWSLLLGTEAGSPAEKVYPALGYNRVGYIPQYGYSPVKGKMCDEVWFHKDLRKGTL